ncbi:MAG: DUF302 domain-containing protein [Acidimicrobiia bacterium]|nr:DUF302 domain-containing protein [Acidimicrobiia bacterium]
MAKEDAIPDIASLKYGYGRVLDAPFRRVLDRTREGLLSEGFGVLFEVDLRESFREKLGADFRNYVIFGVSDPWLAYQTLQQETATGLLISCNVVVYEEHCRCVVAAVAAEKVWSIVANPRLELAANVLNERLHKVVDILFP